MESVLVLILMFGIIPAIISLLAGYIYGRRTQKRGLDLIFDLIKPYFIVNSIIFIPLAIGTAGFADSPGMLPALLLIAFILLFMLMPLMLPFALLGTHIYRHFKIKIPKVFENLVPIVMIKTVKEDSITLPETKIDTTTKDNSLK